MAEFASSEWIEQLAEAALVVEVDPAVTLVVEQVVTRDEPTAWHITLGEGRVQVTEGRSDDPTITLTSSFATAVEIQAGRLSPQRAFLDGALRIGGDLQALIAHRSVLADIAALLSPAT